MLNGIVGVIADTGNAILWSDCWAKFLVKFTDDKQHLINIV